MDPLRFCCGFCKKEIKTTSGDILQCGIHYACGEDCFYQGKCYLCQCDGCGKPATDCPLIANCKCIYDLSCYERIGYDRQFKGCAHCDESGYINGYIEGVVFSIQNSLKPKSVAYLDPNKFYSLMKYRNWKAATFTEKPAYTTETFIKSNIPYITLKRYGFSLDIFKKLGFDFCLMVKTYGKNKEMNATEFKDIFTFFKPTFAELINGTNEVVMEREGYNKVNAKRIIINFMHKEMGLEVKDVFGIVNTNKDEFLRYAGLEVWSEEYSLKELEELFSNKN